MGGRVSKARRNGSWGACFTNVMVLTPPNDIPMTEDCPVTIMAGEEIGPSCPQLGSDPEQGRTANPKLLPGAARPGSGDPAEPRVLSVWGM